MAGWVYGVAALGLGVGFLGVAMRVLVAPQDAEGRSLDGDVAARSAFKYSILYLFALFAALAIDHLVR